MDNTQRNEIGANLDPQTRLAHSEIESFVCRDRNEPSGPECGRSFPTKIGLSQHRRRAHQAQYMRDCEQRLASQPVNAKITQREIEQLAKTEVELDRMRGSGSTISNDRAKALVESGKTNRTYNSIRSLRQKPAFKAAVTQFSQNQPEIPPTPELNNTEDEQAPTEHNFRGEWERTMLLELQVGIDEGCLAQTDIDVLIPGEYNEQNVAIVNRMFDNFVAKYPATTRPRPRPNPTPRLPTQARKRKRALYRITQRLWRRNRARCAKQVVSGDWDKVGRPTVELRTLEEFWRPLLETESKEDDRNPPRKPKDESWGIVQPISKSDVEESLKSADINTAPGPDGMKLSDVKKIPTVELQAQFNVWLYTGTLPSKLCEGRTTLIQKVAGTNEPRMFRPITVTGLLGRIYDRIIARRMESCCPVNERQKGFRSLDGCGHNTYLLRGIIAAATDSSCPSSLYLAFLDVKKAFDSVSHHSLLKACKRIGMPEPIIEYVRGLYERGSTRLNCGSGEHSEPIRCKQGVKQGQPSSSCLFNFVIDWIMESCDSSIGFRIAEQLISYLAYCDDLVLLATTQDDLQRQVELVTTAMGKVGLSVNPAKCATMALVADRGRKLWFLSTEKLVKIENDWFPVLQTEDSYKYLGLAFNQHGASQSIEKKLMAQLDQITRAPLKPQQRLWILQNNVVPATYHQLVLAGVTKGALDYFDRVLRQKLKQWLKLPHTTPNSFFYADCKDGGLGLKCLRWIIPEMKARRMIKIQRSADPVMAGLALTDWFQKEMAKWDLNARSLNDGTPMTEKWNRDMAFRLELFSTADCYGLEYAHQVPYVHRWATDGNLGMSGHRYCAAIALRSGVLYSRARSARGRPEANSSCDCCGPNVVEHLGHILQVCSRTYGARIKRHDLLVMKIKKMLEYHNWTVLVEPKIRTPNSETLFVKPDLLAWKEERSVVLDVAVCSDDLAPDIAHEQKVHKYSNVPQIAQYFREMGKEPPYFSAFAVNWRGVVSPKSAADLRSFGVRKWDIRLLSLATVEQGTVMHRLFQQSTARSSGWQVG